MLRFSDAVLTDTSIHKEYFAKLFRIEPRKILAVHVSTDEDLFNESVSKKPVIKRDSFEVLFYGSFLPLHGVDIILRAASILEDLPIHFTLVGGDRRDLPDFHEMVRGLVPRNVSHREWVDYEQLPELISQAVICLGGPFGNTGQARRVLTGKTFQFLAMSKPTVVGEIDGDYGVEDRKNCLLVPQGDGQALADAIRWGFDQKHELDAIGRKGRELYMRNFSLNNLKKKYPDSLSMMKYYRTRFLSRTHAIQRRVKRGDSFLEMGSTSLNQVSYLFRYLKNPTPVHPIRDGYVITAGKE